MAPGVPGYGRFWPAEDLAPFVEHFWTVSWDLAAPETHETLAHPSVHRVLQRGESRLVGVPKGRFTTHLAGKNRVLGTKFRPGGFRPFLERPVSTLTGGRFTLEEAFGSKSSGLEERALAHGDPADWPDLALELGYADQAHFIRDFRRLVGRTPAGYARGFRG